VLSGFFWFLASWAYVGYTRRPGVARYALVAAAFTLGLMSKPMVVTLPIALLLLDVWPLGRVSAASAPFFPQALGLLREKVPLLALSLASSVVTLLAQARGEALTYGPALGLGARMANAVLSYALYLLKTVWPVDLTVVYPHPFLGPGGLLAWKVVGSALLVAALTAVVVWQRARRPYLAVGWLWYLVTLLPVIGIVQVGLQGMGDRYTYVPLVGIFVALAWLVGDAAEAFRQGRVVATAACAGLLFACAVTARRQVETWRDSFTLFGHALEVTRDNWLALRNLGVAWQDARQPEKAIPALEESLRLMPGDGQTWMNLGIAYASARRYEDALRSLQRAAEMRPGDGHVWFNLGTFYLLAGQPERLPEVEQRLRQVDPDLAERLAQRAARARGR
jgi:hypothetical protein